MKTMMVVTVVSMCCAAYGSGRAYLGVKVIDSDTGEPIQGVKVHGGFINASPSWGVAGKDNNDESTTDRNGFCRLSGCTDIGESCCIVRRHAGYYNSGWYSVDYEERSLLRFGRWMPDNVVVTVRLDRIVNPIPLYVRKAVGNYRQRKRSDYVIDTTYKDFPTAILATNNVQKVSNATMAYDMVMGDWLPPIGNGQVADVAFRFDEEPLGWKIADGHGVSIYKLFKINSLISTPGRGNGIFEVLTTPNAGIKLRTAPLDGYVGNLTCWQGRFGSGDGDKTDRNKNRCYAFRIRTEYDDNGNIKSAYYGKIYDDFDLINFEGVGFLYYLNPTPNDRNLEWDRKNNLCPKPGDIGGDTRP